MKRIIIIVSIFPLYVLASPIEDFAEISAMYIGSCVATEKLKSQYCPNSSAVPPNSCITQVVDMLPTRHRKEFLAILKDQFSMIESESSNGVKKGFLKVMNLVNNDSEKACIGYGSSLNTMKYEKYQQLKLISKQIR
jgi:hypothetical protein